jgi:uncharacterized membrane protein
MVSLLKTYKKQLLQHITHNYYPPKSGVRLTNAHFTMKQKQYNIEAVIILIFAFLVVAIFQNI